MLSDNQLYDLNKCEDMLKTLNNAFADTIYTEEIKKDIESCRFLVHRVIINDE